MTASRSSGTEPGKIDAQSADLPGWAITMAHHVMARLTAPQTVVETYGDAWNVMGVHVARSLATAYTHGSLDEQDRSDCLLTGLRSIARQGCVSDVIRCERETDGFECDACRAERALREYDEATGRVIRDPICQPDSGNAPDNAARSAREGE